MGSPSEGAPPWLVDDYRTLVENEGILALALMVEEELDAGAGRWKLTDIERDIRTACRQKYGLYDPSSIRQARFVDRFTAAYGRTLITGPWPGIHLPLATTVTWAA